MRRAGMEIKGVLLDKDDTLIDLAAFWREPIRRTIQRLLLDYPSVCQRLAPTLEAAAGFQDGKLLPESPVVSGTNWDILHGFAKVLAREGFGFCDAQAAALNKFLERACAEYGTVQGNADFDRLLPALKHGGIKLGIATSDHFSPTWHCIQSLDIARYIDLVLTADWVPRPKPAPDTAEIFCKKFKLRPCQVLMVGDSANDMLFAKNAGLVGVLYAPKGAANCAMFHAQYVISDLLELPRLISCIQDSACQRRQRCHA